MFRKKFLKYFKSPTPLFVAEPPAESETNTDYVKDCLRRHCHTSPPSEHDAFEHFMDLMRDEYRPMAPVSPIRSPVRINQCPVKYTPDGIFKIPPEPVWHRCHYNKVVVTGALAPGTRSASITRIKNPFYRSARGRPKPSSIGKWQHKPPSPCPPDLPHVPARDNVNKYVSNFNITMNCTPNRMDFEATNIVTSSMSPNDIFKCEVKQAQFQTQFKSTFQKCNKNPPIKAPVKLTIRKNKISNTFEIMN